MTFARSPHSDCRHRLSCLLLALGMMLLASLASAASPPGALELKGDMPMMRLEPFVSYLCDESGARDFTAIRQRPFQPLQHQTIAFGFRDGTCWFHFAVHNTSDQPLSFVLRINNPVLDQVDLYVQDKPYLALGDTVPFLARPVATRAFTIPLRLEAGDKQDYFLRVQTTSAMNLPIQIGSSQDFIGMHEQEEWLHGAGFGVGAGILIYHLFLWLAVRERVYRFYVLYAGAAIAYLLSFEGMSYRFWPNAPGWNAHAQLFFIFLMLMAGTLFAKDFLGNSRYRWTTWALNFAIVASGSAMLAHFFLPLVTGYRLQPPVAMTVISIISTVALVRWHEGMKEARLFLLAWSLLLLLGMLMSLHSIGLIPGLPFLVTLNGMELGFILQQVLLSLALANRLVILKEEQDLQQQAILRVEAENAAKTEFLAKMSHEIRTPMNALLGITQLLQDTSLNTTQKDYVDTLHKSGHALLHVINDILDYSKIASGKITLESIDFDLSTLLDECMSVFNLTAREKSLSLQCTVGDDVPRYLRGDSNRLRQIILNLLSNAIKFTSQGSVTLLVRRQSSFADGRVRLLFEVSDTGIGIAASKIDSLFDWFTQADSSTAREYGGTGLGLTISQQLVSLMGGSINVRSIPGQGSAFSFSIVLAPAASTPVQHEPAPSGTPRLDRLRVLVVEDNPINQMIISGLLRKLGIQPLLTSSGMEALDVVRSQHRELDLILMDCEMPVMDGYETTRAIRTLEQHLRLPPVTIIALTAHALPEHRTACLAAGMNDYLSKPLMLNVLAAKLTTLPRALPTAEDP